MALPPAMVLPFAATSADVQLLTGPFLLRGWSVVETTGSAATIGELYDGTDETTPLVAAINLAQGTSDTKTIPGNGIVLRTALFLEMISGSMKGSIWFTPITHVEDLELVHGEYGPVLARPGI